jgi:hypothetical protein
MKFIVVATSHAWLQVGVGAPCERKVVVVVVGCACGGGGVLALTQRGQGWYMPLAST